MDPQRTRIGLAVSAVGGIVTAISVYQPWYGIGITQAGVGAAEQQISSLPGLSPWAAQFGAAASSAVGHTVVSVSAHQSLHQINVVLLIIAAATILVAIAGLAGAHPQFPGQSAGPVAALGLIGALLTIFRMVDPPNPMPEFLTLSLRIGAYTTLLGCGAIIAGALWPGAGRGAAAAPEAPGDGASVWSELSGWTPS